MGCDTASGRFWNPQNTLQCVTLNARIENFEAEIVINSGSGITSLRFELFNLINKFAKKPLELFSHAITARTATGENLDIVGTTTVELDFGNSSWYVDCYVIRNFQYSFLLGTDFLIKSGAKIDLAKLEVVIGQDQIPVSVVKRPSQVKMCVVESLEIPARSEALLTGQLSGLSGTVLVQPKYEISSNNSLLYPA